MTPEYTLYLNGYYFGTLATSEAFGDRPEPYRRHERSLWTVYQLARLGEHEIIIADKLKTVVCSTRKAAELKAWIGGTYPDCVAQLDHPVYTRFTPGLRTQQMRCSNGQKLMPLRVRQDVAKGGALVFTMGAQPAWR